MGEHLAQGDRPVDLDHVFGWTDNDTEFQDMSLCDSTAEAHIDQNLTELEAFQLIFDDEFFRILKAETNRYARQTQNDAERQRWSIVTIAELKKFFAIILHMSLVKKPAMRDYFSTKPVLYSSFPSQIKLGRDRFLSILKYLHANDNSTFIPRNEPNHDPLHKVRPLVDLLNRKFKELYTPSEDLTVDEAMIPFRGRVAFKVYMKNKPNKYGVRLEVVADASTGVVLHFEAYTGAAGGLSNSVTDLVTRILQPFEGKNFKVFMDRRYSSPELFTKLLEKKFYPVGTVVKSRKNMPKAFEKSLKKGEVINRRKGQLLATKWKDKRDVYILSTADRAEMLETGGERDDRAGGDHESVKPASIIRYNKGKIGVDRADQISSYYPMYRKTLKWWKKVFFGLFTIALVNVNKYRNVKNGTSTRLSDFIQSVAHGLVSVDVTHTARPDLPAAAAEPARHTDSDHFPVRLPPTTKQKPTKQCVQCAKTKTRHESSWKCKACGVALCVQCFLPYHRPHTRYR